jgi:cytidylate kinase
MAVITVSGPPGCRVEESARAIAQRLDYHLLSESVLRLSIVEAYGGETVIPPNLYPSALEDILAHLAAQRHLVVQWNGAENLIPSFPGSLRIAITAGDRYRSGALMLDHGLDGASARRLLSQLDSEHRSLLREQFRRATFKPTGFDLVCNAESMDASEVAALVAEIVSLRGLTALGLLTPGRQAEIEFHARLLLSRHGIVPAGRPSLRRNKFANRSEQIFANLLDFYRIAWEYEPRTFALSWDSAGRTAESFTPDFYLPEFDTFVELTTMKQPLVTRKNRKLKLLRSLYPNVNIQIFYQKDFQNLVFKYGLSPAPATA